MGNTHNFAPDQPQSHRDEETRLPRRPWRGLWSWGRTGGVCTKAEGFRSGVTPKLGKGLGHNTVDPNCDKDTGFLTLDMFVLQERGAAEEAPAAISQEAPQSEATELEGGAGAQPLPEGQSLLGPLFNPLASVPSVGGNWSCSFLTKVIIYFSDAIFLAVFDFAFLLACLARKSWQGHGSDFITSIVEASIGEVKTGICEL